MYTGRDRNFAPKVNQGKRVVLNLTRGLAGRNVTCNNFFTSYELARELKEGKMTSVYTIRKNREEIPPIPMDMKTNRTSIRNSYSIVRCAPLWFHMCQKNRYVTLLSTLHTEKSVSESDDKKPEIMNFYNATKSGVDVLDERVGTYRCKRKVNRWPMAIFENMLDISAFNAFVIFTELKPTWKGKEKKYRRRLFIVDVADDLISPYISARKALPKGAIASALVQRIQGVPADFEPPATNTLQKLPQANKRSRCHVCTSKNNMNLYSFRCDRCKKYVYGSHLYKICDKCV